MDKSFEYKDVHDLLSRTLKGQVLVSIGNTDIREKITDVYYSALDNALIINTETSENFAYNDNFVIVPKIVEMEWNKDKDGLIHDVSEDDDVYTVDEFHDAVASGSLIPSDGYGTPSNGVLKTYYEYNLQTLAAMKYSKSITHIIWYNR